MATPIALTLAEEAATRWVVSLAAWMPLSVNCTRLMYVGLMFAISTFSLDSFTFELSIGDSSARHSAAPTKQSVNQRSCFCFHESCFEIGSAFPVDISFRTPRNALDC